MDDSLSEFLDNVSAKGGCFRAEKNGPPCLIADKHYREVDLHRFKPMNDRVCYGFGDEVLKVFEEEMSSAVKIFHESESTLRIVRIRGDEYILVDLSSLRCAPAKDLGKFFKKIMDELNSYGSNGLDRFHEHCDNFHQRFKEWEKAQTPDNHKGVMDVLGTVIDDAEKAGQSVENIKNLKERLSWEGGVDSDKVKSILEQAKARLRSKEVVADFKIYIGSDFRREVAEVGAFGENECSFRLSLTGLEFKEQKTPPFVRGFFGDEVTMHFNPKNNAEVKRGGEWIDRISGSESKEYDVIKPNVTAIYVLNLKDVESEEAMSKAKEIAELLESSFEELISELSENYYSNLFASCLENCQSSTGAKSKPCKCGKMLPREIENIVVSEGWNGCYIIGISLACGGVEIEPGGKIEKYIDSLESLSQKALVRFADSEESYEIHSTYTLSELKAYSKNCTEIVKRPK